MNEIPFHTQGKVKAFKASVDKDGDQLVTITLETYPTAAELPRLFELLELKHQSGQALNVELTPTT